MDNDLRKKLEAILEHVKRGVGNEKENASVLLDKILTKHGLTMADIDDQHKSKHEFKYSTKLERGLLFQTAFYILENWAGNYWRKPKGKVVIIEMTESQSVKMSILYTFLRKRLKDEIEITYQGLIHAYGLFSKKQWDTPDESDPEFSEKVFKRAFGMDSDLPYPQLPEAKE